MRGLNAEEARALRGMVSPAGLWFDDEDADMCAVHDGLVARRLAVEVVDADGSDYFITDLGRLALHVSVAIPAVSL